MSIRENSSNWDGDEGRMAKHYYLVVFEWVESFYYSIYLFFLFPLIKCPSKSIQEQKTSAETQKAGRGRILVRNQPVDGWVEEGGNDELMSFISSAFSSARMDGQ